MKKKKPKPKPKASARRHTVDPTKLETMMAVLVRNPTAHTAVRDLLTVDLIRDVNLGLALVWKVASNFFNEHGALPKKELLLVEIQDAIGADPHLLAKEEIEEINQFLDFAFDDEEHGEDLASSDTRSAWAVKTVGKFLEDRLSRQVQDLVHDGGTLPADLPGMLHAVAGQADVIAGLSAKPADVPFPTGWDKGGSVKLYSTGISVLDHFLGGGHRGGEVNLFMGPFGSCKTTVAVMGLVEGARHAAALTAEKDWDGRTPLSVIVSYETPVDELRERCLSYAATIPRKTLQQAMNGGGGLDSLSTAGDLRQYEKELFKTALQAGEPVPGERERAEEAVELLNHHALFLDMTGADAKRPAAGNGYVPEVARALENELRRRKDAYFVVVWIDYLGAMAKRHIEASERDYADLRHLVSGGVLQLSARVAMPFRCPVWVTHQLSGQANARGPTAKIDHTDAAEAKNAAENATFAVVTGALTEDEQLCVFACTKHRREPPRAHAVVRVEGRFNRITDVSDKYVVDRHLRRILSREEAEAHGLVDPLSFGKNVTKANYEVVDELE